MISEALEHLNVKSYGIYVDCTLGTGGQFIFTEIHFVRSSNMVPRVSLKYYQISIISLETKSW